MRRKQSRVCAVLRHVSIAAALMAVAACDVSNAHRYDLQANEVTRYMLNHSAGGWGERATLIPGLFQEGSPRSEIEARLKGAGFKRLLGKNVNSPLMKDVEKGREVHRREANQIVCDRDLLVIVQFDGGDRLRLAESTLYEAGCW